MSNARQRLRNNETAMREALRKVDAAEEAIWVKEEDAREALEAAWEGFRLVRETLKDALPDDMPEKETE